MYYAIDTIGMWGNGTDEYADFPTIKCFSSDQLEMSIDVMVRWRLNTNELRNLYEAYPQLNYKEQTIASIIREQIRFVTKRFSTIETIEYRDEVAQAIMEAITAEIDKSSLSGMVTDIEFELRNIGYPSKYTSAIEEKLASEQLMIQADFEKARLITLAEGDKQARIIEAQGIEEATRLITEYAGIEDKEEIVSLYLYLQTLQEVSTNSDRLFLFVTSGESNQNPIILQLPNDIEATP